MTMHEYQIRTKIEKLGFDLLNVEYNESDYIYTMAFIHKGYVIPIQMSRQLVQAFYDEEIDRLEFIRQIKVNLENTLERQGENHEQSNRENQ